MACGCSKRNGRPRGVPRRSGGTPTPPTNNGGGGNISGLSASSTTPNVTSSPSNNITALNNNDVKIPEYTRDSNGVIKEKGEARKELERLRRNAILKKMGKI